MNRRTVIAGAVAGVALAAVGAGALATSVQNRNMGAWRPAREQNDPAGSGMKLRPFGRSGVLVSEVGFGAWGIGGAYGAVERRESLNALARAEELGCNFVDTATVYGDSELVLGEFLKGRRDRWLVATKYSGQDGGLEALLEKQLQRLGVESIDFYQVHWAPSAADPLYEALYRIRKAGKARLVGVSLNNIADIQRVLTETDVDGFQVPFSLLDPDPYLAKLDLIRARNPGVIVRSALREGFLTGKFRRDHTFTDPKDQRSAWSAEKIAATVDQVERFRWLEQEAGSMMLGAARYPLAFAETSTVILGTKSVAQADTNFGEVPKARLSEASLRRIEQLQKDMGLFRRRDRIVDGIKRLFG